MIEGTAARKPIPTVADLARSTVFTLLIISALLFWLDSAFHNFVKFKFDKAFSAFDKR